DLKSLIATAFDCQPVKTPNGSAEALWMFHVERLRNLYLDQGVSHQHFAAVAAVNPTDMKDFDDRLNAVGNFVKLPDAAVVCAAHKRIRNILKRNVEDNIDNETNTGLLREEAEKQLYDSLQEQKRVV